METDLFKNHPFKYANALKDGLFRAVGIKATDGDTVRVWIDLGFGVAQRVSIRVEGIDTEETRGVPLDRKEEGEKAKDLTSSLVNEQHLLVDTTKQKQTFARWRGDIYFFERDEILSLAERIKEKGFDKLSI